MALMMSGFVSSLTRERSARDHDQAAVTLQEFRVTSWRKLLKLKMFRVVSAAPWRRCSRAGSSQNRRRLTNASNPSTSDRKRPKPCSETRKSGLRLMCVVCETIYCSFFLIKKIFWGWFFFAETFRSFVSHLYCKSPQQCSLAYIFRHSARNDLIFFSHFKNISGYDRKTNSLDLELHRLADFSLSRFFFWKKSMNNFRCQTEIFLKRLTLSPAQGKLWPGVSNPGRRFNATFCRDQECKSIVLSFATHCGDPPNFLSRCRCPPHSILLEFFEVKLRANRRPVFTQTVRDYHE